VKAVREKEGSIIMGWIEQHWMKEFDIWFSVGSQRKLWMLSYWLHDWSVSHDLIGQW